MAEGVSNRIRELRDNRHLTVRDLAQMTGIDFSTLNRLERDTQALDVPRARRIAKALGVKLSELLPDEDVELRASAGGQAILAELRDIPEADVPAFLSAARTIVHAAQRMAAQRNAGALIGEERLVGSLAEHWNRWTPEQQEKALKLWDFSYGEPER